MLTDEERETMVRVQGAVDAGVDPTRWEASVLLAIIARLQSPRAVLDERLSRYTREEAIAERDEMERAITAFDAGKSPCCGAELTKREGPSVTVCSCSKCGNREFAGENLASTAELSAFEIAVARSHDVLLVDASGLGFVKREWLTKFRARVASLEPVRVDDGQKELEELNAKMRDAQSARIFALADGAIMTAPVKRALDELTAERDSLRDQLLDAHREAREASEACERLRLRGIADDDSYDPYQRLCDIVDEECGTQPAKLPTGTMLGMIENALFEWRRRTASAEGEALALQAQLDVAREQFTDAELRAADGYIHEAIRDRTNHLRGQIDAIAPLAAQADVLRSKCVNQRKELHAINKSQREAYRMYEARIGGLEAQIRTCEDMNRRLWASLDAAGIAGPETGMLTGATPANETPNSKETP